MLVHDTARACELSGTPRAHARAFLQVADATDCVISSRSVGKYATGLLLEGYASKGFHVKAKSCNWGPMAGFVLSDPRFTKGAGSKEAREAQRGDIVKAMKEGADEMQVFITEERFAMARKARRRSDAAEFTIRRFRGTPTSHSDALTQDERESVLEYLKRPVVCSE